MMVGEQPTTRIVSPTRPRAARRRSTDPGDSPEHESRGLGGGVGMDHDGAEGNVRGLSRGNAMDTDHVDQG